MNAAIETIKIEVEIQANGIIRNMNGRLIARLVDDVDFESEHVKNLIIKYKTMGDLLPVPTVGRIVYYKSYGTPNGEYKPENRAAIITAVNPAETPDDEISVDLCVFNPTGLFFNQKVKRGENGGQWDWMPYQKNNLAGLSSQSAEPRPTA